MRWICRAIVAILLLLAVGCTGHIPPLSDMMSKRAWDVPRPQSGKGRHDFHLLRREWRSETDYTRKEPDGFSEYVVPHDADADDLYATAISMTEIQTIFDRLESDRLIFVVDACYSGARGGRTFSLLKGARAVRITGDFVEKLAQGQGRLILTASEANEVSLELSELKHGLFTHYLLEALRGKADANQDGRVSIHEVYAYIYDKVSRHSKQVGGNQHPIWRGETSGPIFL